MPIPSICRAGQRRRRGLPGVLALLVAVVALVVPATAAAAAFTARLQAPNHNPTAGQSWPITVTVKRGGTGLGGNLRYEFVSHGAIVGTEAWHAFPGGVYRASLRFPTIAVGHALTFQIEIATAYGIEYVDWAVTARA
jgi:hypothetical protein